MEKGEKKNIIVIKILIILLFFILFFLMYLSVRNIYNNATFYLNGEKIMNLDLNANYEEPGFVAVLNGKNIKNKVKVKSDVDTSKFGEYTVKYTLEYKYLFIKKELIRTVSVKDLVSPELNVNSDDHIYIRNCSGCGIAGSSFFTRTYVCEYYMLGCMGCTVLCCILPG
mgnify:FL=1